jgi:hypothetical protein
MSLNKNPDSPENLTLATSAINRDDLLNLHEHYETVIKDQLDFCYKYLNFYIGLLSAILAGTLTGILSGKLTYPLSLTLLLGPALIIILSIMGYLNVRVFYRRFIEAWITVLNIQSMLGLTDSLILEKGIRQPFYKSQHGGGFIAQFERPKIRRVLIEGQEKRWSAETVLKKVLYKGDTLLYATITFIGYGIAAIVLGVIIMKYIQ